MTTPIMPRGMSDVTMHSGSDAGASGISARAQTALADLSAVMQQAVARVQEKRRTVERTVAAPAPQVGSTGPS